jgi:hypothetical protein
MAKATTTIRQVLNYETDHGAWFAANQALFNRVASFYFGVIQAHEKILDLPNQDALTALEKLTHTTQSNPDPMMPLCEIQEDIPAMFRRAALHAALGSARSFSSHLSKWRKRKEKAQAKGKKFTERPPVPPRSWNKSVTLYAGQWKERAGSSIMLKVWTGSVRLYVWSPSGIVPNMRNEGQCRQECQSCHQSAFSCTLSESTQGKASDSPGRREGRAICRCCHLPRCPKRRYPRPSTGNARHGDTNEHGTAQETGMRMGKPISDIPCQLRFPF